MWVHRTIGILGPVAALVWLVLGSGCSPIPEFGEATVEETFSIGQEAAAREDYMVAIEAFKRVANNSPLDELADDALLGLGDAYQAVEDFVMAEETYRRLVSDYPRSDLVAEAEYKLGMTFLGRSRPATYDQTTTRTAIDQFEYFLETYPQSEFAPQARERLLELKSKLAEKLYRAALLYFTLKTPDAARVYLEAVATDYPETAWARKALLLTARSLAEEGAVARALEAYERLIELYPGTDEAAAGLTEKAGL
jgi:outer membrane protein assembly factor BamD